MKKWLADLAERVMHADRVVLERGGSRWVHRLGQKERAELQRAIQKGNVDG